MDDNSHSFGLLLGEFLDKAVIAMSEVATAAEVFINKVTDNSIEFQHPADAKRMEMITNLPTNAISEKQSSSHTKQKKQVTPSKTKKTENEIASKVSKIAENKKKSENRPVLFPSESDESSSEPLATQRTGKAAGFSANHYIMDEAEDSNAEEENEEEDNGSNEYTSTSYSDV